MMAVDENPIIITSKDENNRFVVSLLLLARIHTTREVEARTNMFKKVFFDITHIPVKNRAEINIILFF